MMMNEKLIQAARQTIDSYGCVYQLTDGSKVRAMRPADLNTALRDNGWRPVPRLDSYEWKKLGFRIEQGQYVSWGGLKKACDIVMVKE